MTHRHALRTTFIPATPGRWALTLLGVLSLVSSGQSGGQRYEHVISVILALALIGAGTVPAHARAALRRAVGWVAGMFCVLAGVLSGTSLDEAMALVAAAIVAGLISLTLPRSRPRVRHAAL